MSLIVTMTVLSLLGGLVATALVTVLLRVFTDGFPAPPRAVWERYVGGVTLGPFELPGALFVHLLLGTLAGGVLPGVVALLGVSDQYLTTLPQTLTTGLAYGVSIYAVSRAAQTFARVELTEGDRPGLLFDFYLLYGIALGAWLGVSRWVGFPLLCRVAESLCVG